MRTLITCTALCLVALGGTALVSRPHTSAWRPHTGNVWGGQECNDCDEFTHFIGCYYLSDPELVCTLHPGEEEMTCEEVVCDYDPERGRRCPYAETRELNDGENRDRSTQQQAVGARPCYRVDTQGNRVFCFCQVFDDSIGAKGSQSVTRVQNDCFKVYTCNMGWGNCVEGSDGSHYCATVTMTYENQAFDEIPNPYAPCPTANAIAQLKADCEASHAGN